MNVNDIEINYCNDIRTIGSMKKEFEAGRASYWHWHTLLNNFISLYHRILNEKNYGILLPEYPVIGNTTTGEMEGKMTHGGYNKEKLFKMIDMYEFLLTEQ